ncbi:MAG: hypothetical protein LRY55_03980 [Leadbetterella sp.]|nr:hypothetical protein [Leadbetterella sp.]
MDKSWIDRYFEGDLSPEEEQILLKKVEQDAEFREEWEFQHSVKRAVHRKEREALKSFLREVEDRRGRGGKSLWAGAAAALLLLTGIWFYFLRDNSSSLAQTYFHPLPNMISPVVRGEAATHESAAAFRAYEDGRYAEAAREFKKADGESYASLYEAVSYLAIDSTGTALRILNNFSTTDNDLPLETYRKWYLGIAFLKTGEKDRAKALFRELETYPNPVREKAGELSRRLR